MDIVNKPSYKLHQNMGFKYVLSFRKNYGDKLTNFDLLKRPKSNAKSDVE